MPRAGCRSRSSSPCSSASCRCSAATWRASSRGERVFLDAGRSAPVERLTLPRCCASTPPRARTGRRYARSAARLLARSFWLVLYLILRTQTLHPFNPQGFHSGTWDVSFNTASSFVTNTNWQFYGGETTMTYFSQMAGLAVQNFVSAAVGHRASLIALIRGARRAAAARRTLGNFWQDLVRTLLYVLLPLSIVARAGARLPGRDADARPLRDLHPLAGATQHARARPGRLAGGDQGARDQRRRLLQRQLGDAVREPDRALELPRDVADPADPRVADLRPTGAWSATAARAGRSSRRWSMLFVVGVAVVYVAEQHGTPAQHLAGVARRIAARPAATWRARSSASGSPTRRSGRPSRPSRRAAPSTRRSSR